VVKLASQAGLSVVSRSGGHHYAAYSSGVIDDQSVTSSSETSTTGQLSTVNPIVVVDVSNFTSIDYDKDTGVVSVGAGCRLERVTAELAKLGRALPRA
jgi:FAD/FMN-containing dehydrogenase